MRRIIVVVGVLCIVSIAYAAGPGTSTAQFLKLGIGARATAMGEAASSTVSGADAIYWNTAGLGATTNYDVAFTHVEWIDDLRYEYVSGAVPIGRFGVMGIAYGQLTMGELEGRNEFGEPTGNFTAGDKVISLGYGIGLFNLIRVGAAVKYISSQIEDEKASAYAGDFGLMVTPIKGLTGGFAIYNVGSDMTFINEPDPLPLGYRGGASYEWPIAEKHNLIFSGDAVKFNDFEDVRGGVGAEYTLLNMISGRVGYKINYDTDKYSGGAGFKYRFADRIGMRFDYSYNTMEDFGAAHRVSLGVSL
jgi:hypothetical protein